MYPHDISHCKYRGTGAEADPGRATKQEYPHTGGNFSLQHSRIPYPVQKLSLLYRWIVARVRRMSYPLQLLSPQLLCD